MSKDTTFVRGTIVEADYLNADQEVDTGLVWGLQLGQSTPASIETRVGGDPNDTQAPMVVGGRRVWKNGASTPALASGAAGVRDLYVSTNVSMLPDFNVEVLDTATTPAEPYFRRIGSAEWDGVSVLDNIRLEHGVQAEAYQFNQFTFQSISDAAGEVPLTIAGHLSQNSAASTLLSIGSDDGGGYTEYARFRGDGTLAFEPATATQLTLRTSVSGDSVNRFTMDANGLMGWGTGALARDTFLSRSASGSLKLTNGAVGGNGIFDSVAIQNSDTGGATWNGAGMVNVLDDLNLRSGQVYRIDGVQFDSSMLADAADIVHKSGTETLTGAKTFSTNVTTFTAGQVVSGTAGIDRQGLVAGNAAYSSRVGTEANNRFESTVGGTLSWGAGGASAVDFSVSRTAPDILTVAVGDRIEQAYNAAVSEPTILINRGTMDAALASGSASKAFSFFIS